MCVSPDGKLIASVGAMGAIRIWDALTGIELRQIPVEHSSGAERPLAYSPNGSLLALSSDRSVFLFDANNGSIVHQLKCPAWADLAFSPDSKTLATLNLNEGIALWDVASEARLALLQPEGLKGNSNGMGSMVFSPNGKLLVSCHRRGGDIFIWNTANHKLIRRMDVLEEGVGPLAFSSDGRLIAAGSSKGTVCVCDVEGTHAIKRIVGPRQGICSLAFSPDGATLAVGGMMVFTPDYLADQGSFLRLWDVATGKEVAQLGGHSSGVRSMAFSRDGSTLITGEGVAVRKYDVKTHKEIGPVSGHTRYRVRTCFFS